MACMRKDEEGYDEEAGVVDVEDQEQEQEQDAT